MRSFPQTGLAGRFFARYRKSLCAFMALLFLVGTAQAIDIDRQSELNRARDNKNRLALMHPWSRPKIKAVLNDMESHGYRPLIDTAVYRSAAKQAQLKGKGVSKVGYSFHMVTDRDVLKRPVPASLAADIVDKRWAWSSGDVYWLTLAKSAESHGLRTGIRWGLSRADKAQIDSYLKLGLFSGKYKRGWDAAHCEPQARYITLSEARKGKRPPVFR